MASQTIPGLGALVALSGLEQVWVNLAGVDYRVSTQQIADLVGGGGGIGVEEVVGDLNMQAGFAYAVRTDLGAFTLTCPTLTSPALIFVQDVGYNAGTNPITISGGALDVALFGSVSAIQAIDINDTGFMLWGLPGLYWRAIPFGT